MKKNNIYVATLFLAFTSSFAFAEEFKVATATFDKNPTSAFEDRRLVAESSAKTAASLEQILAESKKTNQLLEKLIELVAESKKTNQLLEQLISVSGKKEAAN